MSNRTLTINHLPSRSFAGPSLPALSLQVLLIIAASILWMLFVPSVDYSQMDDLGIISILPLPMFGALGLLVVSFCLALRRAEANGPILAGQVIVLIIMLYGITAMVEEQSRFGVTWLHAGFTEHIMRTGTVAPNLEARFNWPGFFVMSAVMLEFAGLESILGFAGWAAVIFNFLYLVPLYVIFHTITKDKRLVWMAIWLFYLTNWVGQDYYSPQALSFFFSLVILSIVIRWFNGSMEAATGDPQPASGPTAGLIARLTGWLNREPLPLIVSTPFQRVGLVSIIVIIFAVIVFSHQLTPQYEILAIGALVVFRRCTLRSLPFIMAAMVAAWLSFMTLDFLVGHSSAITGGVGQVGQTVSANVTERLSGSPEHVFVIQMRMVMTVLIWVLAFLGGLRRLWTGHWDITYGILAAVPFSLLLLQSYGGEAILRIYFFALPFMAFFAAGLFFASSGANMSWRTTILIGLTSTVLLGGFYVTRYGNERMDFKTNAEVAAMDYVYEVAEPRSQFFVSMQGSAWRYQDYEQYRYRSIRGAFTEGDIEDIVWRMKDPKYPASYLILTRSQEAHAELFLGWPPGEWDQRVDDLKASGKFETLFANEDAEVLVLAEHAK